MAIPETHRRRTPEEAIPRFFLYDEGPAEAERDFLHVERIALRSGRNDWLIRPHAHPEHVQILFVISGGGRIRLETARHSVEPPCLIVIPAGVVHEIAFTPGTDGFVATVASVHLARLFDEDGTLGATVRRPLVADCGTASPEAEEAAAAFDGLAREFVWAGPARRAAIGAHLTRLLVVASRMGTPAIPETGAAARDRAIVHRFRELLERDFRSGRPIASYADALAVTHARLNVACRAVAGGSASQLLFARLLLEAQRRLLYGGSGIAEIAHDLGFDDPAYFCRFFKRRVGLSPSDFRTRRGGEVAARSAAAPASP